MKSIRKALTAVCVSALAVTCGMALYACNDESEYNYTVSVKAPDGSVLPDLEVQLAPVENNVEGEKTASVKVDGEGKATFTFDSEVTCNIYVTGFPAYYVMPQGPILITPATKTANITLSYDLKTPAGGDGTAQRQIDVLNPDSKNLDYATYKGYEVNTGVYKASAKSADTTVYYLFCPTQAGIYTVWTIGSLDTAFHFYPGSSAGIFVYDEPEYKADDISETNKNFSYEIEVTDEHVKSGVANYFFGVNVKDATYPAEYLLIIARTGEYEAPIQLPTVSVQPEAPVAPFGSPINIPAGTLTSEKVKWLKSDGSTKAVKGSDGYYYTSSDGVRADGDLIWAAMDAPVRAESVDGISIIYEIDFDEMGQELSSNLTFSDGKTFKNNYHEFVRAYKAASNNEGFYPVNDELKDFLTLFALKNQKWIEHSFMDVEEGYEWMFACATYKTASNPIGSSAENPIPIDFGTQSLLLPANSTVYYKLQLTSNLNSDDVALTSSTAGLTLSDGTRTMTATEDASVVMPIAQTDLTAFAFSVTSTSYQQCARFTLLVRGGDESSPLEISPNGAPVTANITSANVKLWYYVNNSNLESNVESIVIASSSVGLNLVVDGASNPINETVAANRPLSVTLSVADLRSPFYVTAKSGGTYQFTVTANIAVPGSSAGSAIEIEQLGAHSITYVKGENALVYYATYTVESDGIYEFALADETNGKNEKVQISYVIDNVPYITELGQSRINDSPRPAEIPEKHKILLKLTAGQVLTIYFTNDGSVPYEVGFTLIKQGTYVINVEMPNGSAATDVQIQLLGYLEGHENDPAPADPNNDDRFEFCLAPQSVDLNGSFSFEDDGRTYAIHIFNLPQNYTYSAVNIGPNNKAVTVKLIEK